MRREPPPATDVSTGHSPARPRSFFQVEEPPPQPKRLAPLPPPPSAPAAATHDDSSLFSLDSLVKTEASLMEAGQKHDDSGLIDLNALGTIEKKATTPGRLAVPSVVAPPDLFPMSPTLTSFSADDAYPVRPAAPESIPAFRPRRGNALVVVGAVLSVCAAGVAFVAMRSAPDSTEAKPAVAAVATTAAPSPVPAPPPVVEPPKSDAVTPGQAKPREQAAKPAVSAKPAGHARSTPRAAAAPAAAAPKAAPAAPVCDLSCQMQRAVGH